jgi:hypothetical protein
MTKALCIDLSIDNITGSYIWDAAGELIASLHEPIGHVRATKDYICERNHTPVMGISKWISNRLHKKTGSQVPCFLNLPLRLIMQIHSFIQNRRDEPLIL